MSRHIEDMDGNLVAINGIQNVSHVKGKGVIGLNHQRKPTIWLEEPDDACALEMRDALKEVVATKGRCGQPNWAAMSSKYKKAKAEKRKKISEQVVDADGVVNITEEANLSA